MREWFALGSTPGRLVPQTWEGWAALLAMLTVAIGGSVLIGVANPSP